jgi:chorismate lyase/3-hydroxybenzoate synthase
MRGFSPAIALPSDPIALLPGIRLAYAPVGHILPAAADEALLGVLGYGGWPEVPGLPGLPRAAIPLDALDGGAGLEAWYAPGPVTYGAASGIRYATNGSLLFGLAQADAEQPDLAAQDLYARIIELARAMGYPALVRMWNYLPAINREQFGLERYRRFCVGRYQAFADAGFALDEDLPAASAIGSARDGLWVVFLAGKGGAVQVENPRQISAYRYPPAYGPRSPSFSRAMLFGGGAGRSLFISGTASILGHQTVHPGELVPQCRTTLTNLQAILDRVNAGALARLGEAAAWKVYLRHPRDYPAARSCLAEALHPASPVLYLAGDICRDDLLVEIEGVVRLG